MIVIDHVGAEESLRSPSADMLRRVQWTIMLMLSVVIYGSHAPLISICRVDGVIPFSSSAVVLLVEVLKFIISLACLLITENKLFDMSVSWRLALPYAFPAILYGANNNLVIHMQHFMDPSSFQVLSNLKIVSTALLYSIFLGQRLSIRKWFAMFLLTAAGVFYSYGGFQDVEKTSAATQLYISLPGLLIMVIYCLISGMSAVYTEMTLKTQKIPLNLQNIFLYSFGIVINLLAHLSGSHNGVFLDGFSIWVFVIVITQAFNGLIMSVVMKHSSNITRLFIISCSMLVNGLLSYMLFQLQLTFLFFLAVILIGFAVYLFYGIR
ncbi:probable UDP-sugar transporter protein SLC35A4 [Rana temporaria]|uniref:probable UDP-sugar transporter protein SLC35A4 n=1 Tax=Rana temporaria TaxID=8407 RepID=UPI001AACC9D0|nr:probable UDP-sugar transporter protein SLC35A4 [Rana temporaria]